MIYINNLGTFSSLQEVWGAYPYGGKEGDYVTINGENIGWNKYTNRWEGESQSSSRGNQPSSTPPSAEPSTPTSTTITTLYNNLGEFNSIQDVWRAFPYGGKEGDYVVIKGVNIGWNKYTNNWGDDNSSSSRGNQPSSTPPSAEPSEPVSATIDTLYNNLGEYNSLQDVWKEYPYGGKEGDYIILNGKKIGWNKYTNNWGDDENSASSGNQPAYTPPSAEPNEPSSVAIDTLYNNLGTYTSVQEAWKAYPYGGKEGDYIVIDGKKIGWNKYYNIWGDGKAPSSYPAIEQVFEGSVTVKGLLRVLGGVNIPDVYENIPIDHETIQWVGGVLQATGVTQEQLTEAIQNISFPILKSGSTASPSDMSVYSSLATKQLIIEALNSGGSGGSVSPELVKQIASNTSNIAKLNADSNTVGSVDYKVNHFQWLVIE